MDFYDISLKSMPRVVFVYQVEKQDYNLRFPGVIDHLLEIGLCLNRNILYTFDDGSKRIVPPGATFIITHDDAFLACSEKPGLQQFVTFGITADYEKKLLTTDQITFSKLQELEERITRGKCILLPAFEPLGEDAPVMKNMLLRAAPAFQSSAPESSIACLSQWLDLCSWLTRITLKKIHQCFSAERPSNERYTEAAMQYIHEHLAENIRVEQLAAQIGVSLGYLQNIFHRVTGYTLIEYINRKKVELVKTNTIANRITLAQAAHAVGIEDPAYMSRLFRKVTGISFRDYQAQKERKIR